MPLLLTRVLDRMEQAPSLCATRSGSGRLAAGFILSKEQNLAERTVCIATLALKPGAVLAQAVRRADGVLLLPAGSEVDADQLQQLLQRGVEYVHVLQEETRDTARIARDVAAAEARVVQLFRGKTSEARQQLAAAVSDYRRREAS